LEGFRCDKCKKETTAVRKIAITQFPQVLNIQLMRFVYDMERGRKKKLTKKVTFESELDLHPFIPNKVDGKATKEVLKSQSRYTIYAILCHIGESATAVHYIVYILDDSDNTWWRFDDDKVTKCKEFPFAPSRSYSYYATSCLLHLLFSIISYILHS